MSPAMGTIIRKEKDRETGTFIHPTLTPLFGGNDSQAAPGNVADPGQASVHHCRMRAGTGALCRVDPSTLTEQPRIYEQLAIHIIRKAATRDQCRQWTCHPYAVLRQFTGCPPFLPAVYCPMNDRQFPGPPGGYGGTAHGGIRGS